MKNIDLIIIIDSGIIIFAIFPMTFWFKFSTLQTYIKEPMTYYPFCMIKYFVLCMTSIILVFIMSTALKGSLKTTSHVAEEEDCFGNVGRIILLQCSYDHALPLHIYKTSFELIDNSTEKEDVK